MSHVPMPGWDDLSPRERVRMAEVMYPAIEDILDTVMRGGEPKDEDVRDIYDEIHRAMTLRMRARMIKETRRPSTLQQRGVRARCA